MNIINEFIAYLCSQESGYTPLKRSTKIVILISFLMSSYAVEEQIMEESNNKKNSITNAYNIVDYSFRGITSETEIIDIVNEWSQKGKILEISSLKSICKITPDLLEELMPKNVTHKVCLLVR